MLVDSIFAGYFSNINLDWKISNANVLKGHVMSKRNTRLRQPESVPINA